MSKWIRAHIAPWLIDLAIAAIVALVIALALAACATPPPPYVCGPVQDPTGRALLYCQPWSQKE